MDHRAGLDVLEERKIFFHCRDSNPEPSSPWPRNARGWLRNLKEREHFEDLGIDEETMLHYVT